MPKKKKNQPMQLPELFIERMKDIVPGDRFIRCMDTFSLERPTSFRINPLKAEPEEVLVDLKREGIHLNHVGWMPGAFWIAPRDRAALVHSHPYKEGLLYVQNLSSMVPPLVLDPQPGERVLDLTAAPGSKTIQMAAMMKNAGEIVAVELVRGRFFKLLSNIKQQGATNVTTVLKNGAFFWREAPESFDRVLLDTPCSTEGRFCTRKPETLGYWSERKIREMTRKQNRLFFSAVHCLKPGGVMVYSTCSFAPEENEAVLSKQLKKFGDAIEVEAIKLPFENVQPGLAGWRGKEFPAQVRKSRRILPTPTMEGFFVCKLRKTAPTCREKS